MQIYQKGHIRHRYFRHILNKIQIYKAVSNLIFLNLPNGPQPPPFPPHPLGPQPPWGDELVMNTKHIKSK